MLNSFTTKKSFYLLLALVFPLLFATQLKAQFVTIPANGQGTQSARQPFGTFFGYERSQMLYTATEMTRGGVINEIAFFCTQANTVGATPYEVRIGHTTQTTLTASTVANAEQGTILVASGTLQPSSFVPNDWVVIPLTTPFTYNGTENLKIVIRTNEGGNGNEGSAAKRFRHFSTTGTPRFYQTWSADNNPPTSNGSLQTYKPVIRFNISTGREFDLATNALLSPVTGCGNTASTAVRAVFSNRGSEEASNFFVGYQIDNRPPVREFIFSTVEAFQNDTFTFSDPVNLAAAGTYRIKVWTELDDDEDRSNDTLTTTVTTLPLVNTFPYFENFEAGQAGWTIGGEASSWAFGTPAKTVIQGAGSGQNSFVTGGLGTGTYNNTERSFVISPCLDFSSLGSPIFEMKAWWSAEGGVDGAQVQYSTNNGTTWFTLGSTLDTAWYNNGSITTLTNFGTNSQGWTGIGSTNANPGLRGSMGWRTVKTSAAILAGRSNVRIRVFFASNASIASDGFAFDDIRIFDRPANDLSLIQIVAPTTGSACSRPANQQVTVAIRNDGSAPQTNYQVAYRINNNPPVIETINQSLAPNTQRTYNFNTRANLSAAGDYVFTAWVILANDASRLQDTVSNHVVSTLPTISAFPYTQNFENGNGGWLPRGQNSSWALGTPNKVVIRGAASGANAYVTGGLGTGTYNNNEASFIESPCINFSTLTFPVIEFKIWWQTERTNDGVFVQASTNGGTSYTTVGTFNAPGNWYNTQAVAGLNAFGTNLPGWSGGGGGNTSGSNGWVTVQQDMLNLAGQANVKIRIVFGSNATVAYDGVAIDDIKLFQRNAVDAQMVSILFPTDQACGIGAETPIRFRVRNNGTQTIANLPVSYQINNGPIVSQTFPSNIPLYGENTFTFTQLADLSAATTHNIRVFTTLNNDGTPLDNEQSVSVKRYGLPYDVISFQRFPGSGSTIATEAPDWAVRRGEASNLTPGVAWGLQTYDLNKVIRVAQTTSDVPNWFMSPEIKVGANSRILFKMAALATNGTPANFSGGNAIELRVSNDCGQTWTVLRRFDESSNPQLSSTLSIYDANLVNYANQYLRFAFVSISGTRSTVEYRLDDIEIRNVFQRDAGAVEFVSPPQRMILGNTYPIRVRFRNYGTQTLNTFSVVARIGTRNYSQPFSQQLVANQFNEIGLGNYVAGTQGFFEGWAATTLGQDDDRLNDTTYLRFQVYDPLSTGVTLESEPEWVMYPNPAIDALTLRFRHAGEAIIQVLDAKGVVYQTSTVFVEQERSNHQTDIANLPRGFYLIRVSQNGSTQTQKLLKQ